MKKFLLFFTLWTVFIYLLIAAYSNQINIFEWPWPAQYVFIVVGLLMGAVISMANNFRL